MAAGDIAISVESLSKSYLVGHEPACDEHLVSRDYGEIVIDQLRSSSRT